MTTVPAKPHLDGVFTSELVQQFVHIMTSVALSNLNDMREMAGRKSSGNPSIPQDVAFKTCLNRVRNWNRVIIVAEHEMWIQRYPQLPRLFEHMFMKILRQYNKTFDLTAKGVHLPALTDFIYFFMCNVVMSNEATTSSIFQLSQLHIHLCMIRALRQTCLDCITVLYFPRTLLVEAQKNTQEENKTTPTPLASERTHGSEKHPPGLGQAVSTPQVVQTPRGTIQSRGRWQ